MGIINTIKNFFKKNKTLAPGGNPDASLDKDIVPYDTSLVIKVLHFQIMMFTTEHITYGEITIPILR